MNEMKIKGSIFKGNQPKYPSEELMKTAKKLQMLYNIAKSIDLRTVDKYATYLFYSAGQEECFIDCVDFLSGMADFKPPEDD